MQLRTQNFQERNEIQKIYIFISQERLLVETNYNCSSNL